MQTYPLTIPTFDRIRQASLHVVLIQPEASMNPFVHSRVGLNHVTVFVARYGRLSFPLALNSTWQYPVNSIQKVQYDVSISVHPLV